MKPEFMPVGSFAVIRMTSVDRPGAIELLDQQNPRHRVGKRQVGKPDPLMRGGLEGRVQSIGPADDQCDIVALALPGLQPGGERFRGERCAALVQDNDAHALGDGRLDPLALCSVERFQGLGTARLCLDRPQFELELRRKALGVVVPGGLRPVGHALPDCDHQQLHDLEAAVLRATFLAAGAVFFAAVFAAAFLAGALFTTTVLTTGLGAALFAATFLPAGFCLATCSAARIAVLAALERRSELFFAAGAFPTSSEALTAVGFVAPSLVRTGLSPQISSRW